MDKLEEIKRNCHPQYGVFIKLLQEDTDWLISEVERLRQELAESKEQLLVCWHESHGGYKIKRGDCGHLWVIDNHGLPDLCPDCHLKQQLNTKVLRAALKEAEWE